MLIKVVNVTRVAQLRGCCGTNSCLFMAAPSGFGVVAAGLSYGCRCHGRMFGNLTAAKEEERPFYG